MENKNEDLLKPGSLLTHIKDGGYFFIIDRDEPILNFVSVEETGHIVLEDVIEVKHISDLIDKGDVKKFVPSDVSAFNMTLSPGFKFTQSGSKMVYKIESNQWANTRYPYSYFEVSSSDGSTKFMDAGNWCSYSIKKGLLNGLLKPFEPAVKTEPEKTVDMWASRLQPGFRYTFDGLPGKIIEVTSRKGNTFDANLWENGKVRDYMKGTIVGWEGNNFITGKSRPIINQETGDIYKETKAGPVKITEKPPIDEKAWISYREEMDRFYKIGIYSKQIGDMITADEILSNQNAEEQAAELQKWIDAAVKFEAISIERLRQFRDAEADRDKWKAEADRLKKWGDGYRIGFFEQQELVKRWQNVVINFQKELKKWAETPIHLDKPEGGGDEQHPQGGLKTEAYKGWE